MVNRHFRIPLDVDDDDQVQNACAHLEERWFTQTFDHTAADPSQQQTYGQRYYINRRYFNESTASPLIFLMISGEWTMGKNSVCFENRTFMHAAKEHGALAIQLEHRFFGMNRNMT